MENPDEILSHFAVYQADIGDRVDVEVRSSSSMKELTTASTDSSSREARRRRSGTDRRGGVPGHTNRTKW